MALPLKYFSLASLYNRSSSGWPHCSSGGTKVHDGASFSLARAFRMQTVLLHPPVPHLARGSARILHVRHVLRRWRGLPPLRTANEIFRPTHQGVSSLLTWTGRSGRTGVAGARIEISPKRYRYHERGVREEGRRETTARIGFALRSERPTDTSNSWIAWTYWIESRNGDDASSCNRIECTSW